MTHQVKIGMTDYSVFVFIPDPASTDGSGKTGLVAANLTVSGSRMETDNDATVTDYTSSLNNLAALTTAHTDWGLIEISSTLAPGLYRLDIADAIFAAGAWTAVVYVMITSSAAAASPIQFTMVPDMPINGVNVSLWNSLATVALPLVPATAGRTLVVDAAGLADANMVKSGPTGSGTAQTARDIGGALPASGPGVSGGLALPASGPGVSGGLVLAIDAGGRAAVDVQRWLAHDVAATSFGIPNVNTVAVGNTTQTAGDLATLLTTIDDFVDTEVADIQARLPAALTAGGFMKADLVAIDGDANAQTRLKRGTLSTVLGTCAALGTTTVIIASALTASAVDDQFIGRIIVFDTGTTTAALRGQATVITDYVHATLTFTVTAMTTAPALNDTFTVV